MLRALPYPCPGAVGSESSHAFNLGSTYAFHPASGASPAKKLSPSYRRKDSKSSTHYRSPLPRNDPRGGARSGIKGRLLLFSASIQSANWPQSQTVSVADTSPQSPRPSGQHLPIGKRDCRDIGIQYGFSSVDSVQEPCRFGSAYMEKAISRYTKSRKRSVISYKF